MTAPGKNFPGQKGYPTPNSTPGEIARRIFVVPDSEEWLGLLMWAAQTLSDEWRYYQWGALTPGEAAAAWEQINIDAYLNGCPVEFPTPEGGEVPVFRVNATTGKLEQLNDDQEWEAPSGDYAVPAIPARGGTEEDAICLAAANAANVLEELYEQITDGIAAGNELDEILLAVITTFVTAVGWGAAAGILFSLGFIALVAFGVVVAIIATFAADVWDDAFTEELKCVLVGCAQYDAGVVTFDYQCVLDALAHGTDALNFDQLRLFGQLAFILNAIGGADGLNQAGATTVIESASCCGVWCQEWTAAQLSADFTHDVDTSVSQFWTAAVGNAWSIYYAEMVCTWNGLAQSGSAAAINNNGTHLAFLAPLVATEFSLVYDDVDVNLGDFLFGLNAGSSPGSVTIVSLKLKGHGSRPAFIGGSAC